MVSANKKRIRVLSHGSDSEDVEEGFGMQGVYRKPQEPPKSHENGGEKRQNLGIEDVLNSDACILCDGKDNWVLVCNEPECPVAIHQRCMAFEADYDELGNFYCSYCWHKCLDIKCKRLKNKYENARETLKGLDLILRKDKCTEESESLVGVSVNPNKNRREGDALENKRTVMKENLQKKVRLAEAETSDVHNFNVDEGRTGQVGCSEGNHGNETITKRRKHSEMGHQSKTVDAVTDKHGRKGQGRFHESNQQSKAFTAESQEHELPKNDERVVRRSQLEEGRYRLRRHTPKNQLNKTVETEIHEKSVDCNKGERRKQLGGYSDQREGLMKRDGDKCYVAEYEERQCQEVDDTAINEQGNSFRKYKQVEPNASSSFSSSMPTDNANDLTATSQEFALVIHPNFGGQEQPIEAQPYCTVLRKRSSQHVQRSIDSERKHKRLFWTPAEEEMLKVGVQKFPGNKNIPWRKILEFGRNVFHNERVPSDLKDKWKSINKTTIDRKQWARLSTETKSVRKLK